MTANKSLENKVRYALNKAGYGLHKSRRSISIDNLGGYMIVDLECNAVVAGCRYDLSLEDVSEWLQG